MRSPGYVRDGGHEEGLPRSQACRAEVDVHTPYMVTAHGSGGRFSAEPAMPPPRTRRGPAFLVESHRWSPRSSAASPRPGPSPSTRGAARSHRRSVAPCSIDHARCAAYSAPGVGRTGRRVGRTRPARRACPTNRISPAAVGYRRVEAARWLRRLTRFRRYRAQTTAKQQSKYMLQAAPCRRDFR